MYIENIELKNFRNYRELKVSFSKRVNIFLGNNAQGKTNLLESIYMNSMAKSFKNVRDREMIRFGEEFCKIKTDIYADGETNTTEILINRDGRKGVKVNGVRIRKTSELLERIFIVVFSPEDLKIVKEDPEKRRKFTDRELCQIDPGYYSALSDYRKVLKQRNSYLKESSVDPDVLDVWDTGLAKYGSRIIKKRRDFITDLDRISSGIHESISGGREKLSLKYEPDVSPDTDFYQLLCDSRSDDIRNRTTGHGPHRDDIKISADGIDLRKFGSQGQQRTAALSLKLSEIKLIEEETGEKPVLLLDDVLSELDNQRQSFLINSLGENQMFITTADISGKVVEAMPAGKIFRISAGEVEMEI